MKIKVGNGQLIFDTALLQRDELEDLLKRVRQERIELTNRAKNVRSDRIRAGGLRKAASIKRMQEKRLRKMLGLKVKSRQPRRVRRIEHSRRIEQAALTIMETQMKPEAFEKLMTVARLKAEQTPMPPLDFRTALYIEQLNARIADLESQTKGLPRPPRYTNRPASRSDRKPNRRNI